MEYKLYPNTGNLQFFDRKQILMFFPSISQKG